MSTFGKKINYLPEGDAEQAVQELWAQLNYIQETIEMQYRSLKNSISALEKRLDNLGG